MRQALCTVGKLCRTFSQLHWSTFDAMPIEKRLVGRLNDLNIKTPTEIQQKVKIMLHVLVAVAAIQKQLRQLYSTILTALSVRPYVIDSM